MMEMGHFPSSRNGGWRLLAVLALIAGTSCAGGKPSGEILASGTVEVREVRVAAQAAGKILEIRFEEGLRVKTGDILAIIDHESYDIQLRQAEAGVALAEAQLLLLRNGARQEDIRQAEELLRQSEAGLRVAESDVKRMRDLAAKGSVTAKQKEDAEARYSVTKAQTDAAAEGLKKLRQLARPEEIRAGEARLAQAVAAADLFRKTISDCTIMASAPGIVTSKPVEAGEFVAPGSTVATISELDLVHVMIYVTESELGRVRLDDGVEVRVDAFPGHVFAGKVTYISPEAEFTPKNVQTKEDRVKLVFGVKVEIPNPEGLLKPGLPADATIRASGEAVK